MKKLTLCFVVLVLVSIAAFTLNDPQAIAAANSASSMSGCSGPKQEKSDNGVQLRVEICGSDYDGYDIDASNPDTGEKWDCACEVRFRGKFKDKEGSVDFTRSHTITVSSTAKGWFNGFGDSGIKHDGDRVKDLSILNFSVSCRK